MSLKKLFKKRARVGDAAFPTSSYHGYMNSSHPSFRVRKSGGDPNSDNRSDSQSFDCNPNNNNNKPTSTNSSIAGSIHSRDSSYPRHRSVCLDCEAMARQGQWEVFVQTVRLTVAEDWNMIPPQEQDYQQDQQQDQQPNEIQDGLYNDLTTSSVVIQTSTPLHLALWYRAPVSIVDALIQICRDQFGICVPEECQDEEGNTPLHTAVAAGCAAEVVDRLLHGPTLLMPAILRNVQQQTPLHVACATPVYKSRGIGGGNSNNSGGGVSFRFRRNHGDKQHNRSKDIDSNRNNSHSRSALDGWNKRQVIQTLLHYYPAASALTDAHGCLPLQYLRAQNLSRSTELKLQRLQQLHKCNSSSGGGGCEHGNGGDADPHGMTRVLRGQSQQVLREPSGGRANGGGVQIIMSTMHTEDDRDCNALLLERSTVPMEVGPHISLQVRTVSCLTLDPLLDAAPGSRNSTANADDDDYDSLVNGSASLSVRRITTNHSMVCQSTLEAITAWSCLCFSL